LIPRSPDPSIPGVVAGSAERPYFGAHYRGCQTRVIRGNGGLAVSRDPHRVPPWRRHHPLEERERVTRTTASGRTARRRIQRGRSEVGRRRSYRVGAQNLQEEGPAGGCAAGSAAQTALREAERSASAESGGRAPAKAFPRLTRRDLGEPASPALAVRLGERTGHGIATTLAFAHVRSQRWAFPPRPRQRLKERTRATTLSPVSAGPSCRFRGDAFMYAAPPSVIMFSSRERLT
jgi:hypothetical protein